MLCLRFPEDGCVPTEALCPLTSTPHCLHLPDLSHNHHPPEAVSFCLWMRSCCMCGFFKKMLPQVLFLWFVCLDVCLCTMYLPGVYRGHKWVFNSLWLEVQTIVSYYGSVGIEPLPSGRAESAPDCWAISPALHMCFCDWNLLYLAPYLLRSSTLLHLTEFSPL